MLTHRSRLIHLKARRNRLMTHRSRMIQFKTCSSRLITHRSRLIQIKACGSRLMTHRSRLIQLKARRSRLTTQRSRLIQINACRSRLMTYRSRLIQFKARRSRLMTHRSRLIQIMETPALTCLTLHRREESGQQKNLRLWSLRQLIRSRHWAKTLAQTKTEEQVIDNYYFAPCAPCVYCLVQGLGLQWLRHIWCGGGHCAAALCRNAVSKAE